MTDKNLWQQFLDKIYTEVNSASFHAWFSDLKLVSINQNKIVIQVPMEIHKRILNENYYSLIDETFFKLTNINYTFEFVLKDEISLNEEIGDVPSKIDEEDLFEEDWNSNLNPNLNFDNYVVGDSNRLAKVAGMAVAEQPGKIHNPLFIYGREDSFNACDWELYCSSF